MIGRDVRNCLIPPNRIDRVIELLNEEDNIDITDYYRQILFYVSKQENNVLNILESLDFELIRSKLYEVL